MKILLIDSGIGRIYRGVERYTINLALALANLEKEVIVIGRKYPAELRDRKNIQCILSPIISREHIIYSHRPFEEISSSLETFSLTFSSFFKVLRSDFDVAILSHYSDGYTLPLLKYLKRKNMKVVFVIHSVPKLFSLPFYLPAVFADKTICVSNFVRKKLTEILPVKNPVTIYNGVDTTKFFPSHQEKNRRTILYVGGFLRKKGIFTLLKVAKELKNTTFWIVGSGPEESKIKEFARKHRNVKIFIKVNDKELVKLYSKATMTVVPSEYLEALSIVPLESFSCETPVIASKIGGLGEIVMKLGGITFTPRNIFELKNSIIYLLENENLRKKIAKRGRKIVKKSFDWKIVAQKYIEEIEKIL